MSKPPAPGASDHLEDVLEKVSGVDESAIARLHENGRKAWTFLGDRSASDWVDEIRGNSPDDCAKHKDEIARLRSDLEKATESRKQAQHALYDARERFQKEVLQRTAEVSRLLKERQDCEPFGYFRPEPFGWTDCAPDDEGAIPLYAAPPKREPLSEQQIDELHIKHTFSETGPYEIDFARSIEQAHGIWGQS